MNDPTPQHKTNPLIKKTHVQYNANCSTQLLQQGDSSALGPVPAFAQHKAKLRVASILSFSAVPPAGSQFCLTRYPAYEPAPTACEVTWPGKNKQNIKKAANMRGAFLVRWVRALSNVNPIGHLSVIEGGLRGLFASRMKTQPKSSKDLQGTAGPASPPLITTKQVCGHCLIQNQQPSHAP